MDAIFPRKRGVPVLVRMLEIRAVMTCCRKLAGWRWGRLISLFFTVKKEKKPNKQTNKKNGFCCNKEGGGQIISLSQSLWALTKKLYDSGVRLVKMLMSLFREQLREARRTTLLSYEGYFETVTCEKKTLEVICHFLVLGFHISQLELFASFFSG